MATKAKQSSRKSVVETVPRFEIRTPHKGFRGERAGVKFFDGVGRTDNEHAAKECERFGYVVIEYEDDVTPDQAEAARKKAEEEAAEIAKKAADAAKK